ncbi:MAG: MBL fold metallo-hydrolase, partial [Chloroflexota bacterium]|nr:MBL fold metallo-hydrolase [Chloroflexota bacterium]
NAAPRVYLVAARQGALIDSAYGDEEVADSYVNYARDTVGVGIDYLIITHAHPDHISGAPRLLKKTAAKLTLHSAEVSDLPIDNVVNDGDIISLGGIDLEVVHTPGHNPGHMCLYIRKDRIMFSGDCVLAKTTTALQPPWGDMAQYIESLKKLLKYDVDLMLPAHGPPIREPRQRIEELIRHRLEREEQVLELLRKGKSTVKEIAADIYPDLTGFLYAVSQGQVYSHLLKLEREGKATSEGDRQKASFKAIA